MLTSVRAGLAVLAVLYSPPDADASAPTDTGVAVTRSADGKTVSIRDMEAWQNASSGLTGDLRVLQMPSRVRQRLVTVRVLLPDGYAAATNGARYPVLYLLDGQNLFSVDTSTHGAEWQVDETISTLRANHAIPPLIVVGVDHPGLRERGREYLPWPDRYLRPPVENPEGTRMPELLDEVIAFVEDHFSADRRPAARAIGGSSYGALAALYISLQRPGRFGALLLESPSFYVNDGAIFKLAEQSPAWPSRIYLGVGTNEEGAPSCDPRSTVETEAVADVKKLDRLLKRRGFTADRHRTVIEPCAGHSERVWAARFPDALRFLFGQ